MRRRHRRRAECTCSDDICGVIGPIRREKMVVYVRVRGCNVYCVHVCIRMYMILNPQGKCVERHNESTSALPMLHACVSWTHQHVSYAIYDTHTHTRVYMCYMRVVCILRENRPRSKACPWYIEPTTISDNLFRKQWKRTPHREWMNIQGLSNDWVSQKSGLLPTRDSSLRARDVMQI